MIRTRIRQYVKPEDSNTLPKLEGYKMKELESSLFGEIRMATYSIGRCHGSFVCRPKGGQDIVYKMQPDAIRESFLYFKFGSKVFEILNQKYQHHHRV